MAFASTSVWQQAAPPACALMPGTSVPPCIFLVSFELLSQCWSQREWVQVSSWDSRSPLFHWAIIPDSFYSQKLWGLLPALEPWARGVGVGLGLLTTQGDLCSWDIPFDFYLPCETSLFLVSIPPTNLSCWLILYIRSCRTSIQLDFSQLFCSLVVLLRWLWKDVSTTFTYVMILTRSWEMQT